MIGWAIETLVASTLLMLVVLAIRTQVRDAFGPNVAYALWALPVLRMGLPPLPDHWRGQALPAVPDEVILSFAQPVAALPLETPGGVGWAIIAIALWVAGASGFIVYHVVAHRRFCARVRRLASDKRAVAGGQVEVIETDAATGPLAFGVLRKYVAFPRDFAERYDSLERDLALAHELGHHARGDLIANWIALTVLALHWFNPVAWRAFRAFRSDQEMACDALVLAGRAAELRHAYGRAIVKSTHGGAVSAACHLHTVNEIKGRLRMLSRHERISRLRSAVGVAAIITLSLTGLGATASGTQAAEHARSTVETTTGVDIASLELPRLGRSPDPSAAPPAPSAAVAPRPAVVPGHGPAHAADDEARRVATTPAAPAAPEPATRPLPPTAPVAPLPPEARAVSEVLPAVVTRDCRTGEGRGYANVIERMDGGTSVMIVCRNRIERTAAQAERQGARAAAQAERSARLAVRAGEHAQRQGARAAAQAAQSARLAVRAGEHAERQGARAAAQAKRSARLAERAGARADRHGAYVIAGLNSARARIDHQDMLTADERRAALSGIDQAIRDMGDRSN